MALGLDRLVTVRVVEHDRNDFGEAVTVNHDSRRWSTRMDQSNARIFESYGSRTADTRIYRTRWYSRLATASTSAVKVLDSGDTFTATNIVEVENDRVTRRRRFIEIECTRSTP